MVSSIGSGHQLFLKVNWRDFRGVRVVTRPAIRRDDGRLEAKMPLRIRAVVPE